MKKILQTTLIATTLTLASLQASISGDIKKQIESSHKKAPYASIYQDNLYEPLWVNKNGLTDLGKELLEHIKNDKTLTASLPYYKLYKTVQKAVNKKAYSANLDLMISKLYFAYMNNLINGSINWKVFDVDLAKLAKKYDYKVAWEHSAPPYSAKKILEISQLNGSLQDSFSKVEPTKFKYRKLKKFLENYIAIAKNGGWKPVYLKRSIHVGESSPAIPAIRKRLKLVGDLNGCSAPMDSTVYDNCMAKAIKRFKLRHGIKASSVIGKQIRKELRRPISYYIQKIRLNLDRIKWTNRKENRIRIHLNIPEFRLYLYDGKQLVTTMRVITGKPDHPTAIFSDVMTTIVVNPYWRIPESIVRKEMIKHLLKNPHYYDKQHKYLYKGWGPDSEKINPAKVNWKQYQAEDKHIPYHFMQDPGTKNALGKIKFLFPNKYSVYIHDTPGKRLFFRNYRAYSHGCMRIQKPRELLEALALYNSNIHVSKIMKILGTNNKTDIALRRRIPIDITYFTSFVDDYGNLHFRDDVYGYDRLQLKHYRHKSITATAPKKDTKKNLKKTKQEKATKKKYSPKESAKKQKNTTSKSHKITHPKKHTSKKNKKGYDIVEIGY